MIALVNLVKKFVVTDDDMILPITNMFDMYGEETDVEDLVVTVVAGEGFHWVSTTLTEQDFGLLQ